MGGLKGGDMEKASRWGGEGEGDRAFYKGRQHMHRATVGTHCICVG